MGRIESLIPTVELMRIAYLAMPWIAVASWIWRWMQGGSRSLQPAAHYVWNGLGTITMLTWVFIISPWSSMGDLARTSFVVGVVMFAAHSAVGAARVWRQPPGRPVQSTNLALAVMVACGSAGLLAYTLAFARSSEPAVLLSFPLDGEWMVNNGGATWIVNGHAAVAAQRHALDIVKRGPDGRSVLGDRKELGSYHAWNQPVYAPAAGRIVETRNDLPDMPIGARDRSEIRGNHVVMQLEDGTQVLLAHLRQASVTVRSGERVTAGQLLGRVGNSGNTTQPHLHLGATRLQNSETVGVPFCFTDVDQDVACPIRNQRVARLE